MQQFIIVFVNFKRLTFDHLHLIKVHQYCPASYIFFSTILGIIISIASSPIMGVRFCIKVLSSSLCLFAFNPNCQLILMLGLSEESSIFAEDHCKSRVFSFISLVDSTPGIDRLRKMVLIFHWTNMTKVLHPIPVHSKLHHKYSYIQLVFCLTNQYFISWEPQTSLDRRGVGRKGNHQEIVWLVGRK